MRKQVKLVFGILLGLVLFSSCSKVPAGNVGIKFYLLGGSKGVDHEELSPGRYWIGVNEELYIFPTFTQNYVWTADESSDGTSPDNESFNFQDVQGLELNADIGITYHLDKEKVSDIFQKYKRGIDEITDVFLRNMVRDELVKTCSKLDVEYIYGKGRADVIKTVQDNVSKQCAPLGINIDKLYWIGRIKLPAVVKTAIDNKIKATQIAQQRENELREAEAKAKKKIAEAEGKKQSRILAAEGKARAIEIEAEAQAKANRKLNASITKTLVDYKKIERWDGKLPHVNGSGGTIVNLK